VHSGVWFGALGQWTEQWRWRQVVNSADLALVAGLDVMFDITFHT